MEKYEFQSHWTPISSLPISGTRCIVTDGDTIAIGTYASPEWLLDGIGHTEEHDYKIIGWMPVPKPMKKTVAYVDGQPNKSDN